MKTICLILLFAFTQNYKSMRNDMVEQQIVARGITDSSVLDAMQTVPRHLFIPDQLQSLAYQDRPLPIGMDQTISQPYIVAYMTESLHLNPDDVVLEIGTGSGYQAAVLAEIVKEVYSIEIVTSLAKQAEFTLKQLEYSNVHVKAGDGYHGWKEHAPYDAIIITAAPLSVPPELINQLAEGGRLIVPEEKNNQQYLTLYTKNKSKVKSKRLLAVRFVPFTRTKE